MKAPAIPADEVERLADLYDYGILDTPAEKIFDEIAELAATICGTEIGAVTLIDRDRQWFKSQHGRFFGQTTRDESICGHAILHDELFEVCDTRADERFDGNSLLEEVPGVRFYAGSRLNSDRGHAIGMLCVMDSRPRELGPVQRQALRQLADVVITVIEAGRRSRLLHWFGLLLDNIADEILILNPNTLRYLHVNRAAQDHLGYTVEEMRRLTPMDVTREHDRAKFEGFVARLRAGEPSVTFDGRRRRVSGEEYPVEVRWQLLQTGGFPVVLSIVQDVTERREIERMKDEFISVVNHELRTPLTSIHGAIKLLEQGAAGELPAPAAHLVELAAQNSQRLRQIVDDILDLEKIASGRMQFDLEPLHAREVLERACAAYSLAAASGGVVLQVDADPSLRLRADARRLQQVLANFVSNAVKFAPPESVVTLSATVSPERARCVRLQVVDRGPGVPEKFGSRIFERFAQADMRTSRSKGGSGLGLSIARQMTEQMGGAIGFDSRPGATRFFVDLPQEDG
ncbi:MAG: ATP-binding protein [Usitatibacter sp.]